MISESHTRQGSRVSCQGSAWRPCCFCQATMRSANEAASAGARRSLIRRWCRRTASSLALLHLLDRHGVVEQRQVDLDERGVGRERRREGMLAQGLGELDDSRLELLQPLVLGVDLADPGLELAGRVLHLLERLDAPLERLAALAQLAVDLGRDRLVPELELAARVLEDLS